MLCHVLVELLFGLSYLEVCTLLAALHHSVCVLGFEVHWNVKFGEDPSKFI